MKLSNTEIQEIHTILEKYCNTKEARSMKSFCQHGSVSTYEHVMYVTKVCYYLNKRLGLGSRRKVPCHWCFSSRLLSLRLARER